MSGKLTESVIEAARLVWDYHHVGHELVRSDIIFVLGSHDLRVADRAAELFLAGWAPLIVFSGGFGNFTAGHFTRPEAELFAERAIALGVTEDAILRESRATNSGENVQFTRELLEEKELPVQSVLAVQKPYMERRAYATIRKQWPEIEVRVTSPQIAFDDYCNAEIPLERLIHIMVGDLQRIMTYPERGFQIHQDVPDTVRSAFDDLVAEGFDGHLG